MSTMDWIITLGCILAALRMKDLFLAQRFEETMRARRPRPHTFG